MKLFLSLVLALALIAPAQANLTEVHIPQAASDPQCDKSFNQHDADGVFQFCVKAAKQYEEFARANKGDARAVSYAFAATCWYQVWVAAVATEQNDAALASAKSSAKDYIRVLASPNVPANVRTELNARVSDLQRYLGEEQH
jgi:hypothetical protein